MTVSELIARLELLPPGLPIVTYNDDDHLAVLTELPRIVEVFRYDQPDIVFYGTPDGEERAIGASEAFPVVVLGVAD